MPHLEPTYLRYIYDGLLKGSIHPENAAELPEGLIGMYEEAFDERTSVIERQKLLQRFAIWALLKKEVSAAFVAEVLGETEDDITQTIQYLKEANPTHYTITIAYPIKGTSLYNEIEDIITIAPDWETSTDRDIDFKRTYSRKYYKYAVSKVVNEVEFHRAISKTSIKALKLKTKSILATGLMKLNK